MGTDGRPETEQVPAYDLVVIPGTGEAYGARRFAPLRPDAGFLIQLLVSTDPGLRSARLERTRSAAASYAEAARRIA
ncbi:hypothetical protein [Methylobacterium sp. J-090]|uniref:hypothetical protein n=1 Tax=Methylobacterium sp. J-090 TaxID=2836666 RepID=UPI001FB8FEEC|nr:hypothetical protein [Methylobacterium sp. J-090]